MKTRSISLAAVFLLAALPAMLRAETVNKIAAVVGNDVITEHELQQNIEAAKRQKTFREGADIRRQVIDKLIDDIIFDQLIDKAKIEVSDDDLARAIAGVLQQNQMSLEQLKNELAEKGKTYEQYKKDMAREVKKVKYINQTIGPQVKITEQDMRDYYQRHQDKFRGTHGAHIAMILLPFTDLKTQEDFVALKDLALSISAKAREGKNFSELATQYSKGPNAESGGDMGMVELKTLPPVIAEAVRSMKVGETSRPILSENAIAIVKVISLPEISASDFDKMRDSIYGAMYDERIDETLNGYLMKQRQRTFIDIR